MPHNDDHAAALEAMASGEHTDAAQQAAEMETTHDADADNPAVALADSDEQNDAIPATPVGSERARQKKIRQAHAKATGTQMKKTMIPLLLVSGVILLLLGGMTAIMGATGDLTETGAFDSGTILLLTVAAFVLGPILIIGGWLLHADIKKSER
jgi:uncharacterized membrane protein